jgi:hypothetical protein
MAAVAVVVAVRTFKDGGRPLAGVGRVNAVTAADDVLDTAQLGPAPNTASAPISRAAQPSLTCRWKGRP